MLLDALALRLDPDASAGARLALNLVATDLGHGRAAIAATMSGSKGSSSSSASFEG